MEITSATLARDGKKFFLTENHPASGTSTSCRWTVARAKMTSMTGSNEATVSPDESTLGLVYSYSTSRPRST